MTGDRSGAGKDHVVKRQVGKCLADFRAAIEYGDLRGVVGLGDHFCHQRGSGRGKLRWLNHGPVTCRKDAGKRREHHIDREIPWRNNADYAQGLVFDARAAADQVKGKHGGTFFRFHPRA